MNENNLHVFPFKPLKKLNKTQIVYSSSLQVMISNDAPLVPPKLQVDIYDLYLQKIQQNSQKLKTQVHDIEFIDFWPNNSDVQLNVFKTIFQDQNQNIKYEIHRLQSQRYNIG